MPRWPPILWVGRSGVSPKIRPDSNFWGAGLFLCRLHLQASQNTSTANGGWSTDQGETTKMTRWMKRKRRRISERLGRLEAKRENWGAQLERQKSAKRVRARSGEKGVQTGR